MGLTTKWPSVSGLSLRLLHDPGARYSSAVRRSFSRRVTAERPQRAGAFLERFPQGSEVLLKDGALLNLIDACLCDLARGRFCRVTLLYCRA